MDPPKPVNMYTKREYVNMSSNLLHFYCLILKLDISGQAYETV